MILEDGFRGCNDLGGSQRMVSEDAMISEDLRKKRLIRSLLAISGSI